MGASIAVPPPDHLTGTGLRHTLGWGQGDAVGFTNGGGAGEQSWQEEAAGQEPEPGTPLQEQEESSGPHCGQAAA